MVRESEHGKQLYPEAAYVGIAEGTKINWDFLGKHATMRILDFYCVG
jgi:hypothetical protein